MLSIIKLYFQFDDDEDNNIFSNEKNLLDKFLNSGFDWEKFLKEITLNFRDFKDQKISQKLKDCFRIHMYLPDLRKENKHLEFESSTIHQMACYDMIFRTTCTYNYYSHYITQEYMTQDLKNKENKEIKTIKILREDLY